MAGTNGSTQRPARLCACAVLISILGLPAATAAQERPAPGQLSRLRASDSRAAALLEAGNARSATFRQLTEAIERSDLVVHVETRRTQWQGQTLFAAATPRARYLRIYVRPMGLDNELLPLLAHELCHAVEIARAPEVRDRQTLRQFYERTGSALRTAHTLSLETTQATAVQMQVLEELRTGR